MVNITVIVVIAIHGARDDGMFFFSFYGGKKKQVHFLDPKGIMLLKPGLKNLRCNKHWKKFGIMRR